LTALPLNADQIPVAHTPIGGYGATMPPPILAGCTDPLVPGAPDMRGVWKVVEVRVGDTVDPAHRAIGAVQRIEQAADRVVITAGGIVHDKTTEITVVATFEDGAHVLRPVGVPIEVTRRLVGGQLIWDYLGFTAVLERASDEASALLSANVA
jgi:hypothetical protein